MEIEKKGVSETKKRRQFASWIIAPLVIAIIVTTIFAIRRTVPAIGRAKEIGEAEAPLLCTKETTGIIGQKYYNRGNAYYDKGEYDQALSDYTKAIEINRRYAEAYHNRGLAYKRKGQYDQAISDYNKALEINPRLAQAYYNRGAAYGGKGEYDQAISDYNKALETNPKFPEAYVNRGNIYSRKAEHDLAISDYNKAIEINPRFADAYCNRGLSYANNDKYDLAISDYTKAIEINPRFARGGAYVNRGNVYTRKGKYDQAISDYTKAIEINPEYAQAYYNRGSTYYHKGEYDKAWEDVYKTQSLGYQVRLGFLKDPLEASGRHRHRGYIWVIGDNVQIIKADDNTHKTKQALLASNPLIARVMYATLRGYEHTTIGGAFNSFFANPEWQLKVAQNGAKFVQFSGRLKEDIDLPPDIPSDPIAASLSIAYGAVNIGWEKGDLVRVKFVFSRDSTSFELWSIQRNDDRETRSNDWELKARLDAVLEKIYGID